MSEIVNANEFWLNFTNVMLGAVTLICIVAVAHVAFQEIVDRRKAKSWVSRLLDDHTFVHADLGITMADGGKPIHDNNFDPDDDANIVRSVN